MGEIFESSIFRDASKIPKDISFTDFIFQLWRKQVPKVGEKPWLVDTSSGKNVIFKDVEARVKKVASGLARRGFGHGDFIFFVTHDIVDLHVLQLAAWMLGGATRGSFQRDPPEEYVRQMSELKCKFVAVDTETAPNVVKAVAMVDFKCELINFDGKEMEGAIKFAELAADDGTAFPSQVKVDPQEDILFVCNTSGTTGPPKGVIITHYSFVALFASFGDKLTEIRPDENQFITSHNYSISMVWTALGKLASGNTMFSMGHFKKENFADHLIKYKPAKLMIYPYIAAWFARLPDIEKHDFSFVKSIMVGGSVLDPTTAELLQKICPSAAFSQAYASTEALGVSSTFPGKGTLYNFSPDGERMVSSGFLMPFVKAKITDMETGDLLGRNQLGRLHVRSLYTTKGYLVPGGKPDRSKYDEEGWLDTGDMGFFDSFGQLFVRERTSFVYRYSTEFVNPSEIEAVLHEHPSIAMACVVGVPNVETTCLTKALVVLKEGKSATEEELKGFVADKMSFFKRLHGGVEFLDSLPENRGGKLDRLAVWKKYCRMN